jgi:hypothetical protein
MLSVIELLIYISRLITIKLMDELGWDESKAIIFHTLTNNMIVKSNSTSPLIWTRSRLCKCAPLEWGLMRFIFYVYTIVIAPGI